MLQPQRVGETWGGVSRRDSGGSAALKTSISDVWPPELGGNKFLYANLLMSAIGQRKCLIVPCI